jgi:hypothetical protein
LVFLLGGRLQSISREGVSMMATDTNSAIAGVARLQLSRGSDPLFVKLEPLVGDALLDNRAADLVRGLFLFAHNADCGPRTVPRRQLSAAGIAREGMKLTIVLGLEHEQAHGALPSGKKEAAALNGGLVSLQGHLRSGEFDRPDRDLAGTRVILGLELHLLAFTQTLNAGALQRGGMNKHVLLPVVRLDEAKAFLIVIEFHGA